MPVLVRSAALPASVLDVVISFISVVIDERTALMIDQNALISFLRNQTFLLMTSSSTPLLMRIIDKFRGGARLRTGGGGGLRSHDMKAATGVDFCSL